MNYLKIPLNDQKKATLREELDRLFMLQDRSLTESKREFYIQELDKDGFPFDAIIKGIRALSDADLKSIKFFTIKESVRQFVVIEDTKGDCCFCRGNGRISMEKNKYAYTFSCKCEAGLRFGKEYPRWNGSVRQEFNGEMYELSDYKLLGDKYYDWLKMNGITDAPATTPDKSTDKAEAIAWVD